MAQVGIRELLEAGVHFGHQTRRWNPKMRRFIHGESGGIYIIDLLKTQALLQKAQEFAAEISHRGGTVLFVGTKKQARDAVREIATEADMPYVNNRWLGGLLTNFGTISHRINRLHDLERYQAEGQLELLPTRERMAAQADLAKLQLNLGGVKNMQRVPDAMFVVDLNTEEIAVREAQRLRIPIIGLVDTNCDPDGIDFVVPGNDDGIRSCTLVAKALGDVVGEGRKVFRAEEERARKEAEEQARKEAEERARREAEAQAKREAEEAAKAEADAAAAAAAEGAAPAPGGGTAATTEAQQIPSNPAPPPGGPAAPKAPKAPKAKPAEPSETQEIPSNPAPPPDGPVQTETETANATPPAPAESEAVPAPAESKSETPPADDAEGEPTPAPVKAAQDLASGAAEAARDAASGKPVEAVKDLAGGALKAARDLAGGGSDEEKKKEGDS
ncbi:MAG: 30S ribosomal protein S2 [Solirubrobacteraceae bacterium]